MLLTDSIEMSVLWMYVIYFNMGLLNEIIILTDYSSDIYVIFVKLYTAGMKSHHISFPLMVLCFHRLYSITKILHRKNNGLMCKHSGVLLRLYFYKFTKLAMFVKCETSNQISI